MPTIYSNPRKSLIVTDWPMGASAKTTATFTVESKLGKGERISRVTLDRFGNPCAAKTTTYAEKVVIVDGDDGKTYILELTIYGSISVTQSNLKFSHESIQETDSRFIQTKALIFAI